MTLAEAAKVSGYSQDYLRVAIHRKLLKATKKGRDWHVTPKALEAFKTRPR